MRLSRLATSYVIISCDNGTKRNSTVYDSNGKVCSICQLERDIFN